ncbi:uncharacterized protein LAESUDRAFT_761444 [Laetiporus sulphureus 93-53]|uniref:Uncharacterized protein n=1 Tax=Laetiporus sulphureus 93-53 TaxID=1314785 RepID=A0A165D3M9_9APHY|nr:uncharacterized protein LAESUDRAFT_761444 [Laetiporus sulphureus 93-53]KZT04094.1 hypothetical protein LAESUDRAFT_761444 [Laetiporus sulphureus 93-53]
MLASTGTKLDVQVKACGMPAVHRHIFNERILLDSVERGRSSGNRQSNASNVNDAAEVGEGHLRGQTSWSDPVEVHSTNPVRGTRSCDDTSGGAKACPAVQSEFGMEEKNASIPLGSAKPSPQGLEPFFEAPSPLPRHTGGDEYSLRRESTTRGTDTRASIPQDGSIGVTDLGFISWEGIPLAAANSSTLVSPIINGMERADTSQILQPMPFGEENILMNGSEVLISHRAVAESTQMHGWSGIPSLNMPDDGERYLSSMQFSRSDDQPSAHDITWDYSSNIAMDVDDMGAAMHRSANEYSFNVDVGEGDIAAKVIARSL